MIAVRSASRRWLRFALPAVLTLATLAVMLMWWLGQRETSGVVYWIAFEADTFTLVPASRSLPDPRSDAQGFARAALDALRRGPGERERVAGVSSAVPGGTEVLAATLSDGRMDVDLSSAFAGGGGTASMRGRLEQVRWTLSEPEVIHEVRLLMQGTPLEVLGGEGLLVEPTWIRAAHAMPRW